MTSIGFGSQGVVRFVASSSQDDQPSAGFEELAMPRSQGRGSQFASRSLTLPRLCGLDSRQ